MTRDEYRDVVDYADFRGLLRATPRLQEFHLVNAAIYVDSRAGNQRRMMAEEEFLGERFTDMSQGCGAVDQSLE